MRLYALLFLIPGIAAGTFGLMLWIPTQKQELQAEPAKPIREELPARTEETQLATVLPEGQSSELPEDVVSVVEDASHDVQRRQEALADLAVRLKTMQPQDMKRHIGELSLIIRDPSEPLSISILALRNMSDLLLIMKERGSSKDKTFREQAGVLVGLASNSDRDSHLRGQAIMALGDLGIEEALPLVHELCADNTVWTKPELIRPACLALGQLDGETAIPVLAEILGRASVSSVYGTAAYALGQFKSEETMVVLARCRDRFPGRGSCDVVLEKMDEYIFDVLSQPDHPHVEESIVATRSLYSAEHIDRCMPLLKDILTTGASPVRKEALDRILEIIRTSDYHVVQRELREVLPLIENQPELSNYAERIRLRLSAVPLRPISRTDPDQ